MDGADPLQFAGKRAPTVSALIFSLRNDADPVGDVRGYEGSEWGGSVTVDGAAPPHSPSRHEVVVCSGLFD
jgi:hypothetical protein